MTDVHARITEALREHQLRAAPPYICTCGDVAPSFYGHLADVLLALPGIAVVELPEADPNGLFWFRENCYVYVDPEDALIMTQRGTTHGTAGEARETAAALLAAADAAERGL